MLLEAFADAQKIEVTDDEYGHEIVHRARGAGMSPQQYYDQLMRAGAAASVYGDVRRSKALGWVLEQVTIKDSAGAAVSVEELRRSDEDTDNGDRPTRDTRGTTTTDPAAAIRLVGCAFSEKPHDRRAGRRGARARVAHSWRETTVLARNYAWFLSQASRNK